MDASKFNMYFLNEKDEKDILSQCIFVFDTSALLNFYLFSPAAVEDISKKVFDNPLGGMLASNDGVSWAPHNKEWNLHFKTFVKQRVRN
jgi:hypothetical protein